MRVVCFTVENSLALQRLTASAPRLSLPDLLRRLAPDCRAMAGRRIDPCGAIYPALIAARRMSSSGESAPAPDAGPRALAAKRDLRLSPTSGQPILTRSPPEDRISDPERSEKFASRFGRSCGFHPFAGGFDDSTGSCGCVTPDVIPAPFSPKL
jgi:hypothetical protein